MKLTQILKSKQSKWLSHVGNSLLIPVLVLYCSETEAENHDYGTVYWLYMLVGLIYYEDEKQRFVPTILRGHSDKGMKKRDSYSLIFASL